MPFDLSVEFCGVRFLNPFVGGFVTQYRLH